MEKYAQAVALPCFALLCSAQQNSHLSFQSKKLVFCYASGAYISKTCELFCFIFWNRKKEIPEFFISDNIPFICLKKNRFECTAQHEWEFFFSRSSFSFLIFTFAWLPFIHVSLSPLWFTYGYTIKQMKFFFLLPFFHLLTLCLLTESFSEPWVNRDSAVHSRIYFLFIEKHCGWREK